jgi:hypothetical protein
MVKESFLISSSSDVLELLPRGFALSNVLPGALYQQSISNGFIYHEGNNVYEPNNEIASRLTGVHIKGDAVLEVESESLLCLKGLTKRSFESDTGNSPWEGLPQEILGLIIEECTGCCAITAVTLSHVCKSWREKIIADSYMMEKIKFKNLTMSNPTDMDHLSSLRRHKILHAALLSNNITASLVMARYLTRIGKYSTASKYWRSAAKMCHPEGLAVLGFELYSDGYSLTRDPEEAYLLLTRACKRLENSLLSGNIPVLMTEESCGKLLQRAAHILAILIIDNDFLSPIEKDTSSAVRWLQTSHKLGCHEAGKLLQSMFRSGQY